jgi:hypothetical protein
MGVPKPLSRAADGPRRNRINRKTDIHGFKTVSGCRRRRHLSDDRRVADEFFSSLKCFKPLENRRIRAPQRKCGGGVIGRLCFLDRFSLHLEIHGRVPIGRRDAGVAEPLADRHPGCGKSRSLITGAHPPTRPAAACQLLDKSRSAARSLMAFAARQLPPRGISAEGEVRAPRDPRQV